MTIIYRINPSTNKLFNEVCHDKVIQRGQKFLKVPALEWWSDSIIRNSSIFIRHSMKEAHVHSADSHSTPQ